MRYVQIKICLRFNRMFHYAEDQMRYWNAHIKRKKIRLRV